jgi:hypothetical protein
MMIAPPKRSCAKLWSAKATDYVYKDDNPAGGETARQQFVVYVATIGAEDRLTSEETADNGEASIQYWNRERDQGRRHADDRGRFPGPDNAITTQKEPDKQAARVTQKNGGGIKVETQNAQEGSREGNGGNG